MFELAIIVLAAALTRTQEAPPGTPWAYLAVTTTPQGDTARWSVRFEPRTDRGGPVLRLDLPRAVVLLTPGSATIADARRPWEARSFDLDHAARWPEPIRALPMLRTPPIADALALWQNAPPREPHRAVADGGMITVETSGVVTVFVPIPPGDTAQWGRLDAPRPSGEEELPGGVPDPAALAGTPLAWFEGGDVRSARASTLAPSPVSVLLLRVLPAGDASGEDGFDGLVAVVRDRVALAGVAAGVPAEKRPRIVARRVVVTRVSGDGVREARAALARQAPPPADPVAAAADAETPPGFWAAGRTAYGAAAGSLVLIGARGGEVVPLVGGSALAAERAAAAAWDLVSAGD